jgi:hypothetical protein
VISSEEFSMTLTDLVRSDAKSAEISAHLDDLSEARRLDELYALSGSDQARLYGLVADTAPLDLDFFVPPEVGENRQVIHYGKNSQPLFRNFEKRWMRPPNEAEVLWGYNETWVRPAIGPGYFVAHPTDNGGSDERGAVVVDYFQVPHTTPEIAGWPSVRPNSSGLQMFIYNKTRDYLRRVSDACSIGVAYRLESKVMGYFVLCRQTL